MIHGSCIMDTRATFFEIAVSQHWWAKHVACVWPPCCDVLRHVGCCWLRFENGEILSQQHPTRRNMLQQGGQTHATCCAQQFCDMLRWHVVIVWPGLYVFCVAYTKCIATLWYRLIYFFIYLFMYLFICLRESSVCHVV